MSNHSPGPWGWDDHDGSTAGRGGDLLDAHGCPVIATIPTGPDTARIEAHSLPDARLIASAPTMKAMLLELEWASNNLEWYSDTKACCFVCGTEQGQPHAPDCRLASLLDEIGR